MTYWPRDGVGVTALAVSAAIVVFPAALLLRWAEPGRLLCRLSAWGLGVPATIGISLVGSVVAEP